MSSRYGWTINEIESLDFVLFLDLLEKILEAKKTEYKDRLVEGAFIGWQVQELMKSMTGEKKSSSFDHYLKGLGLMDESKGHNESKMSKSQALNLAQEIVNLDRNQEQGGKGG